ncbi:plexin-D1-like [Sardina pilchardus]|uniref:plexin-D1-like n=1 Tax=Sardina pilchardus TaxID=27697 RepID=UPI002E13CE6C
MTPDEVSIHGRNHAVIKGRNLESVTKVHFQGKMDCNPKESPVLSHSKNSSSHEFLTFRIPSRAVKGTVRVCLLMVDGQCHGNVKLTYDTPPICNHLEPNTTWASGGREIMLNGSNLKFVEKVKHKDQPEEFTLKRKKETLVYFTPAGVLDSAGSRQVSVELLVGNTSVTCREELTYLPDPQFTSFTTTRMGKDMSVIIQKNSDPLELKVSEIQVQAMPAEVPHPCVIDRIEDSTSVLCVIENQPDISIDSLKITVGNFSFNLQKSQNLLYVTVISIGMLAICALVCYFYFKKKREDVKTPCRETTKPDCFLSDDQNSLYEDVQEDERGPISVALLRESMVEHYDDVTADYYETNLYESLREEGLEDYDDITTDENAPNVTEGDLEETKHANEKEQDYYDDITNEDDLQMTSAIAGMMTADQAQEYDDVITESLREDGLEDYDDITTDENASKMTKVEEKKHANEKEQDYYDDITNEDDLQMISAIAGMMTADQAQEYDDVITVTMEMNL